MLTHKATCPVEKTIQLLSDSRTMLILHVLGKSPKRFCAIEKDLPGVSTRTITLKLKYLEQHLMLTKCDGKYTLTERGMQVASAIVSLSRMLGVQD